MVKVKVQQKAHVQHKRKSSPAVYYTPAPKKPFISGAGAAGQTSFTGAPKKLEDELARAMLKAMKNNTLDDEGNIKPEYGAVNLFGNNSVLQHASKRLYKGFKREKTRRSNKAVTTKSNK